MATRLPATSLLVVCLAVWRITHLLWGEDGPGDIFVRLRRGAGNGFFGRVLDCFNCLSLWIAAPVAWFTANGWFERVLFWLALSGGAIVVERLTCRASTTPPPAIWHKEPLAEEK